MNRLIQSWALVAAVSLAACGGCDDKTTGTGATSGTNANTANNAANSSTNSPFAQNSNGQVLCGSDVCACDDGIDGDNDGLVDLDDPECTGPYDDDESTFATGIPGDNKDDCQDCFFDGNSGHGDDGCQYATECLLGGNPMGSSGCKNCETSQECYDFCRPRTPNGCDCFGCCEVTLANGQTETVVLGGECSLDDLSNCQTGCVLSENCANSCGRCELCLGKTVADLPADCYATDDMGNPDPTTPPQSCDDGEQPCNGTPDCPTNAYCQLGCCIVVIN